jgi:predicted nucleic acid-binding protein
VIIVSDNSALSCLAELGELELLHRLYGTVTVTATIRREGRHAHAPEALRQFFDIPPEWLVVLPDPLPFLEKTHALDPGEASAITLAWQHRGASLLIMDEKRGRKVSQALGLKMIGAAGLLCDAANAGLIDFEDTFRRLAKTRFRLGPAVVETLRQRHQARSSPPGN